MGGLGGELGDVIEVDVVFGAGGGSHYGLQAPWRATAVAAVVVVAVGGNVEAGRLVVGETLVYQNQGNVRERSWVRAKGTWGERISASRTGASSVRSL